MRHEKEGNSDMKIRRIMLGAMIAVLLGNTVGVSAYAAESGNAETGLVQPQTEAGTESVSPQTEEVQETAKELTAEELEAYYGDSVFIGDSIMLGFRNYCAKQKKDSFLRGIQFLAVGGYSANNAMKPVENKNIHPLYKGRKYQVWDAVSMMKAKKVFIQLGMNDISILGLEGARDRYKEVIDKIKEVSPDVEVNIISVTYTLEGQGKAKLNNNNIAKYNKLLQKMAAENGWSYIDMATPVSDGKGNLAKGACSDGFVHLSSSAYAIWEKELVGYANARQDLTAADEQTADETQTDDEMQNAAQTEKADETQTGNETQGTKEEPVQQ